MLKDALGQPIVEGWAAQIDAISGSSKIGWVYVLGLTKTGAQVSVLGCPYTFLEQRKDLVEAYLNKEMDTVTLKKNTHSKTPTRIIMMNGAKP